jgi:hypothetical protein
MQTARAESFRIRKAKAQQNWAFADPSRGDVPSASNGVRASA